MDFETSTNDAEKVKLVTQCFTKIHRAICGGFKEVVVPVKLTFLKAMRDGIWNLCGWDSIKFAYAGLQGDKKILEVSPSVKNTSIGTSIQFVGPNSQ